MSKYLINQFLQHVSTQKFGSYWFPEHHHKTFKEKFNGLVAFLNEGNKLFFKFNKGSRAGTIAELDMTSTLVSEMYLFNPDSNYSFRTNEYINLKVDDHKFKIQIGSLRNAGVELITSQETVPVWCFTKAEPKEKEPPAVLYDHFGVKLEVGSLVIYPHGKKGDISTRFGHIENISPKGTIKINPIKTRPSHSTEILSLSPTIGASDLIVLDSDLKAKVLMARLTV